LETPKFKLADIFYAIIIPLVLVLLIFLLAVYVNPGGQYHVLGLTGLSGTIGVILTQGFAQMIVLGIPLILGLLWNKWAGGAAGFIMGGAYYMASAGLYNGYYAYLGTATYHNFYGDLSMLFYLVNAIIIGYMAGALNNGSTNFKRMLGAGLTSAILVAIIQVYMNYNWELTFSGASTTSMDFSPRNMAHGLWAVANTGIHNSAGAYIPFQYTASSILYGFTLAFVPSIALGIIVPILAKVMTWYGLQPMRHQ
jgi:hypothetical protein